MATLNDELRRRILDAATDWGRDHIERTAQVLSMGPGDEGGYLVTLLLPGWGNKTFNVNVFLDPEDTNRVARVEPVDTLPEPQA
jgi:hypothetical protein